MLDNLRDQASSSPYFKEEDPIVDMVQAGPPPKKTLDQTTGMTAKQRFLISALLFVVVCLLGNMILLVTGKISIF